VLTSEVVFAMLVVLEISKISLLFDIKLVVLTSPVEFEVVVALEVSVLFNIGFVVLTSAVVFAFVCFSGIVSFFLVFVVLVCIVVLVAIESFLVITFGVRLQSALY